MKQLFALSLLLSALCANMHASTQNENTEHLAPIGVQAKEIFLATLGNLMSDNSDHHNIEHVTRVELNGPEGLTIGHFDECKADLWVSKGTMLMPCTNYQEGRPLLELDLESKLLFIMLHNSDKPSVIIPNGQKVTLYSRLKFSVS